MPKLEELITAVYSEIEGQRKELSERIDLNNRKIAKNSDKENSLNLKEEELAKREKELSAKEQEIEFRWGKIRRDDQVQAQFVEVQKDLDKIKSQRKEIDNQVAENKFLLEQIKKKELELSAREASYKEEIRKELTKQIIGLN